MTEEESGKLRCDKLDGVIDKLKVVAKHLRESIEMLQNTREMSLISDKLEVIHTVYLSTLPSDVSFIHESIDELKAITSRDFTREGQNEKRIKSTRS